MEMPMEMPRRTLPPGWHYDEDTGAIMRDVIHRMGRRCFRWDYCGKGIYMITMTLADRSKPLLGRLVGENAETAAIELSDLGRAIDAHLHRISEFTPEIELLGAQLMPEHLHAVLRVKKRMAKPLGIAMRGFKGGASQLFWRLVPPEETRALQRERTEGKSTNCELTESAHMERERIKGAHIDLERAEGESTDHERTEGKSTDHERTEGKSTDHEQICADSRKPLFSKGYVDNILGDERAVESALRYMADNPRRLWEKRAHPELFKVLREVRVKLAVSTASASNMHAQSAGNGLSRQFRDGPPSAGAGAPAVLTAGFFAAIGNLALLDEPTIFQVQCSRSFFEYRRAADGSLLKDEPPAVVKREFIEKRDGFLEAAEHGAVLLSPCISHGEKEIARLAFEKGLKVITLANKGFNPLYKPGGRLFDQCADGNLLMLAPAAWPYVPGEKKMTRIDACILNRIAQWLAGSGAVEIKYRGIEPRQVDRFAREALKAE